MPITSARRHLKQALLYWLPLILWMSYIYYLSDQPPLPHPARQVGISDLLFDCSAHAFIFGVLPWLVWRVLNMHSPKLSSINRAGLGPPCMRPATRSISPSSWDATPDSWTD